jgi:hypothetical protein
MFKNKQYNLGKKYTLWRPREKELKTLLPGGLFLDRITQK